MMRKWLTDAREWLSCLLCRDLSDDVSRLQAEVAALQRDIEDQRRALRDPAIVRPMVVAALREELARAPGDVAGALAPMLEGLLHRNASGGRREHGTHRARWSFAATVALLAGLLMPRVAGVSQATGVPAATGPHPSKVIVEERNDGFGLGQAQVSDQELARFVRTQLTNCTELADARVSFSVKDGWVWLRGEASPQGKEAAERMLQGMPEGTFVVNQLVTSQGKAVAAR